MAALHLPVLLPETLHHLRPAREAVLLDGTLGLGGHAAAWLDATVESGGVGRVLGLDRDAAALELAGKHLEQAHPGRVRVRHASYEDAPACLREEGMPPVDAALLDLGVSSLQLDRPDRGFSFQAPGPLDMRMDADPAGGETAADVVNGRPEQELERILRDYGEEPAAGRIAATLCRERRRAPFRDTLRLAEVVAQATGGRRGKTHPATRTFQALRIEVNRELERLERGLPRVASCVRAGGRMAVITFHRLEDRMVKRFFRTAARAGRMSLLPDTAPARDEIRRNPRSRSARLRAVEVLDRAPGEDGRDAE